MFVGELCWCHFSYFCGDIIGMHCFSFRTAESRWGATTRKSAFSASAGMCCAPWPSTSIGMHRRKLARLPPPSFGRRSIGEMPPSNHNPGQDIDFLVGAPSLSPIPYIFQSNPLPWRSWPPVGVFFGTRRFSFIRAVIFPTEMLASAYGLTNMAVWEVVFFFALAGWVRPIFRGGK